MYVWPAGPWYNSEKRESVLTIAHEEKMITFSNLEQKSISLIVRLIDEKYGKITELESKILAVRLGLIILLQIKPIYFWIKTPFCDCFKVISSELNNSKVE